MPKNNPKCFQERSQRSIHGPPSLGQGSRAGTRPAPPHLFSVGSEPSQQGQGASWGAQHVLLGVAAHREASCSARGLGPSIPTGWLASVLLWGEKLGDAADPPGAGNGSGSSDKAPACSRAVPAAGTRSIWLRCAGGDGVRRAPAQPSLTLPTALYFPPCSKIPFFFSPDHCWLLQEVPETQPSSPSVGTSSGNSPGCDRAWLNPWDFGEESGKRQLPALSCTTL